MRSQQSKLSGSIPACLALVLCAPSQVGAETVYAADVWPSRVARAPDGRVLYTYDLSQVKAGSISPQVRSEFGEKAVAQFLSKLPREAQAAFNPKAGALTLSASGEPGRQALDPSFAKVSAAAPVDTDVPDSRFRTGSTPKFLPSVDLLLWKAKQFDDGLIASIELAADNGSLGLPLGRRELWNRILGAAIARYHGSEGDEQEAALMLAARVGASNCLETSLLPAVVRRDSDVAQSIASEVARLRLELLQSLPTGIHRWTRELTCIQLRERVLNEPLPSSRIGLGAALVLLDILENDPKLDRAYAALQKLRDSFSGTPREELLERYRSLVGPRGTTDALGDIPAFIARLRSAGIRNMEEGNPPLFARPETPVSRYIETLKRAERRYAPLELALGIQEGRVPLNASADSPWSIWRLAPFLPLLRPDQNGADKLNLDAGYRSRLLSAFYALLGARDESADEELYPKSSEGDQSPAYELAVRLAVPPQLSVEPLAAVYGGIAAAYERLEEVLAENGKAGNIRALYPGGGLAAAPARAQAREMRRLYRGLEILSAHAVGSEPEAQSTGRDDALSVAIAERFLAHWREDSELAQDARFLEPAEFQGDKEKVYAGILGISRRQLEVSFSSRPPVELPGVSQAAGLLRADASASQQYILPVLASASIGSSGGGSLDRARFQGICDKAGRERAAIERAAATALKESGQAKPMTVQKGADD